MATAHEQTCRPGERIVAGEVYVYNANALKLHIAREAVDAAPASLRGLSFEELHTLQTHAITVSADDGMVEGEGRAMLRRVRDELDRQGLDSFGRVKPNTQARAA